MKSVNSETSEPVSQPKPGVPSAANPLDLGPDPYDNWLSDAPLTGGYCVPGDDACEACQ